MSLAPLQRREESPDELEALKSRFPGMSAHSSGMGGACAMPPNTSVLPSYNEEDNLDIDVSSDTEGSSLKSSDSSGKLCSATRAWV